MYFSDLPVQVNYTMSECCIHYLRHRECHMDDVRIFRVTPTVISVLDYSQGFGHTDLVTL